MSSTETAKAALVRFRRDFGSRRLESLTRIEAKDWAATAPAGDTAVVITLMNQAVADDVLSENAFRGLGRKDKKGRSDVAPPTAEEFGRLLDACDVHGWYGDHLRSLLIFAAYTRLRPGEIFALKWGDIDLETNRVHVRRRVYNRRIDIPKSNKTRIVALPAMLEVYSHYDVGALDAIDAAFARPAVTPLRVASMDLA